MKRILLLGLACSLLSLGSGCCVMEGILGSPCLPRNRGSFDHCGYGPRACAAGPCCGQCGGGCNDGCDGGPDCCNTCGVGCADECGPVVHRHCGPLTWVFDLLKTEHWCGRECIDRRRGYWGEIDHCDPCDDCGNFTGCSSCGGNYGGGCAECDGDVSSVRTGRSYRAQPAPEIISDEGEEVVSSRPQRPTPAVRNGQPRRASQPQQTVTR